MLTRPRWLLHLEGSFLLALSVFIYCANGYRWWLFAALFLLPDVFMFGYLINAKWGSALYNLIHTLMGPAAVILLSLFRTNFRAVALCADLGGTHAGLRPEIPLAMQDTHLKHV